jgi:hypothetical protein
MSPAGVVTVGDGDVVAVVPRLCLGAPGEIRLAELRPPPARFGGGGGGRAAAWVLVAEPTPTPAPAPATARVAVPAPAPAVPQRRHAGRVRVACPHARECVAEQIHQVSLVVPVTLQLHNFMLGTTSPAIVSPTAPGHVGSRALPRGGRGAPLIASARPALPLNKRRTKGKCRRDGALSTSMQRRPRRECRSRQHSDGM